MRGGGNSVNRLKKKIKKGYLVKICDKRRGQDIRLGEYGQDIGLAEYGLWSGYVGKGEGTRISQKAVRILKYKG